MNIRKYNHPVLFYTLATAIPWLFWFAAAFLSHLEPGAALFSAVDDWLKIFGLPRGLVIVALMLTGLIGPTIIAFGMMAMDADLRNDLFHRVFLIKRVEPVYLSMTFLLMPASILLAQAISLLFGRSADQFAFAQHFSFSAGLLPVWVVLFLAPLLEELAWHSYGTDCLRRRFNLFNTSIIFGIFWVFWHMPLSFIKDYYHSNLVETGWIYSLNFALSLIPYVLLMNWLYYKTNRNISVAIVFHITAGFFNEIFATHPDSKVIQTVLLLALSVFLIIRDKKFFFSRNITKEEEEVTISAQALNAAGPAQ